MAGDGQQGASAAASPLRGNIVRGLQQTLEGFQRAGVRSLLRSNAEEVEKLRAQFSAPATVQTTIEEPSVARKSTGKASALKVLSAEVAKCQLCPELADARANTVFGVGNVNARLCFFGEAPGADEDKQGEPFVGRAGQLLDKIIEACTLKREDVYILNVIKCRPPGNRNPNETEISNCRSYFEQQLDIIQPEYICCLGKVATQTLLGTNDAIGRLRGQFHDWRGIPVLATYHPAYLLRNPPAKAEVWKDMQFLMDAMGIVLPKKSK